MFADVDNDIEVAVRTAAETRLALGAKLEPRAVVDTGGDLHGQRNSLAHAALALAFRTRVRDDHALAAALTARRRDRKEALLRSDLAGTAAVRAGSRSFDAATRPCTLARFAGSQALELDDLIGAACGLFEFDFQIVTQIVAASAARARTSTAGSEEITENVGKDFFEALGEVKPAEATRALLPLKGGMPEAIVLGASLRVGENLIGLVEFLEFFLGLLVAGVAIGMVLDRQTAVRLLKLVFGGATPDAQYFVIVPFSFRGHRATILIYLRSGSKRHLSDANRCANQERLLHFLEIGVDDIFLLLFRRTGGCTASVTRIAAVGVRTSPLLRPGLAVHRFGQFVRSIGQRLGSAVEFVGVLRFEFALGFGERIFDSLARAFVELRAVILECLLGRVDQVVELVAGLGLSAPLAVVGRMLLGLLHHPLDLLFVQSRRRGDANRLLLAGPEILRRDVHDTVCVDVEGDLHLRHAARRRREPDEIELAEQLVVGRHLTFTLEDPNRNCRLIVLRSRENLALACRNRRVLLD